MERAGICGCHRPVGRCAAETGRACRLLESAGSGHAPGPPMQMRILFICAVLQSPHVFDRLPTRGALPGPRQACRAGRHAESGRWRHRRAHRPLGLRQDHAAACRGGPGARERRRDPHRRPARGQRGFLAPSRAAAHRHGVPGLCAVPPSERGPQRGLRHPPSSQGTPGRARGRGAGAGGPGRQCRKVSARAVRRPATARGAGPRAGAQPAADAAGRAVFQPRRGPARAPGA